MRYVFLLLFCWVSCLQANPLILETVSSLEYKPEISAPNPIALQPLWWKYFEVEGDELKKRIAATNKSLQDLYATLPLEEQQKALPLINKITLALNALFQAQKPEAASALPQPYLKSYPLDKQLELDQQIRKLKVENKNEREHIQQLKINLDKGQKNSDSMLVAYLSQTEPSSKKLLDGLELMAYRSNITVGELSLHLSESALAEKTAQLQHLEEELIYSKSHLDVSGFDERQLEKNIALYEKEHEKRQKELTTAEGNLLGVFEDHTSHFLLEQKVLQASVNKAYAWAKLALHKFKYNLILQLNDRFEDHQHILKESLASWREKLNTHLKQAQEWRQSALKEQGRVWQEYALLVAQNDYSQQMTLNQTQRQNVLQILTNLELLEDEISHTQWLILLLEEHFRQKQYFFLNWWDDFINSLIQTGGAVSKFAHLTLFKVTGIPITLLTLFEVSFIMAVAFWLSLLIRTLFIFLGRKWSDLMESTLYTLGSLAQYFTLLIGLLVALYSIGIDFGNLMIIAGAMLFGISFGLQSIANNFFCGLRILFEKKLQVGDEIELHAGHSGRVVEIHIQNTVVRTSDGQKVIIPNADLISNTVFNWSKRHHDFRRLHIPFAVSPEADKGEVRRVIIEAAKRVPCTLRDHPEFGEPEVWLVNISRFALEFKLVIWVDYEKEVVNESKEADYLWEIESALRQECIPLPPFHSGLFAKILLNQ